MRIKEGSFQMLRRVYFQAASEALDPVHSSHVIYLISVWVLVEETGTGKYIKEEELGDLETSFLIRFPDGCLFKAFTRLQGSARQPPGKVIGAVQHQEEVIAVHN